MNKTLKLAFFVCTLSLLGLTTSQAKDNPSLSTSAQAVSSVRVETLGELAPAISRRFVGRVDAVSNVNLSFQVAGRLINLPVKQGRLLPKGSLLAELDATDYKLALEQAEVRLKQAQRDVDRKHSLLKTNSIPRAVVDEAEDQLRLAELAVEAAERNLSYTRLEAPSDVLITRRLADRYGNLAAGTPVVRVQDVTEFRAHISVPEDLVRLVSNPDYIKAKLLLPNDEETSIPLEYREHATEPDQVVQTYQVTFGFERPKDLNLLPGMTVTVVVNADPLLYPADQLDVALSALNTANDGSYFLWVFDPALGQVTKRQAKVGRVSGDRVELLSGAKAGEQVITSGGSHLREGMKVKPFSHF
ncbi:efflux RND transporter periplasmic adaptor subunit [Marinospirillum minutulum]|uniref:efflux RND transporter periplasmic adaptor subunit n=1 Tax=Marinospirillum minutulum TaxID=64974 RepID=UPI0003FC2F26|nr:efflux RND transporter periplasmic adaptor subunit [Marinospirillum minutulum]